MNQTIVHMKNLSELIVNTCVNNTLSLLRTHPSLQWSPDSYWWPGIQLAWVHPFLPGTRSDTLTARQLSESLIDMGIPASSIKKLGKYTLVELENIAFVYREKQYKYEQGPTLLVSPHILGCKFKECGHAFVSPNCDPDALAAFILTIDLSVPAAKTASIDAYNEFFKTDSK